MSKDNTQQHCVKYSALGLGRKHTAYLFSVVYGPKRDALKRTDTEHSIFILSVCVGGGALTWLDTLIHNILFPLKGYRTWISFSLILF